MIVLTALVRSALLVMVLGVGGVAAAALRDAHRRGVARLRRAGYLGARTGAPAASRLAVTPRVVPVATRAGIARLGTTRARDAIAGLPVDGVAMAGLAVDGGMTGGLAVDGVAATAARATDAVTIAGDVRDRVAIAGVADDAGTTAGGVHDSRPVPVAHVLGGRVPVEESAAGGIRRPVPVRARRAGRDGVQPRRRRVADRPRRSYSAARSPRSAA